MSPIKNFFLAFCIVMLVTACGGGSNDDSSGAGSSTDTSGSTGTSTVTDSNNDDSGGSSSPVTYRGTANIVLTASGFPPISESAALTVVVDGSTVRLTVDGRTVTVALNGDSFSASVPISESNDNLTCGGTAIINGTVTDNAVSGTIGGSGNCSGDGINVPVDLSGSFNATR